MIAAVTVYDLVNVSTAIATTDTASTPLIHPTLPILSDNGGSTSLVPAFTMEPIITALTATADGIPSSI